MEYHCCIVKYNVDSFQVAGKPSLSTWLQLRSNLCGSRGTYDLRRHLGTVVAGRKM